MSDTEKSAIEQVRYRVEKISRDFISKAQSGDVNYVCLSARFLVE